MPNTYGGAISQGISQGLGNVSAMYGLQNQMRQSQREDELYNIKMKEYQEGQQPAKFDNLYKLLDAGEGGKKDVDAYFGAVSGKDPSTLTRAEAQEIAKAYLSDPRAAQRILGYKVQHYKAKMNEYKDQPEKRNEYEMFEKKYKEAALLDKTERQKKASQVMEMLSGLTVKQALEQGVDLDVYDAVQSGVDVDTFLDITKQITINRAKEKAKITPPTEFERYKKMPPAERKEYDEFKGAGKSATDKLTPKGFDQKGRAVYAGPEGNLVYENKTPYTGGQLKGITEPWAPIPPEWEKKEQLNTVRNEIKDVTGQIDAVRKQMTWGLAENGPAEILRLEKHLKDLKAEESRLTGKKETPKTETAIPKQESTNVIRYDTKGNRITK